MKRLLENKAATLYVMLAMYLSSIAIGVVGYNLAGRIIDNPIWQMLIADAVGTLAIWMYGLLFKNSSAYDPYWSVMPPLILIGWIIVLDIRIGLAGWLLVIAILAWSIRLTYNWAVNWKDFSHQDWRYTMIREKNPKIWFLANLFGINMMPTLIVFIQMIGAYRFLLLVPEFNFLIGLGFFMCIGAALIQHIADRQMMHFRLMNGASGKCINQGLWKYSRHPNYFGEVMMWWGVWFFYLGASGRIDLQVIAPIMMSCLFLFISIPMMEKKLIASRPTYLEYKKNVSMLVPFFTRREQSNSTNES